MVTETKETMNKAFDTFNDGFRSAVDASQRTQETWFNFMRDAWRRPADVDRVLQRTERIINEWTPFVGGTMNTMVKAYDTNLRAGMEVYKTIFDNMSRGESTDLGKTTRQVWDAAFEAVRTNFDVMNRVSARTLENGAAFCEAAFGNENGHARSSSQPTRPTGKNEKSNGH
jgi:hypothetical protein